MANDILVLADHLRGQLSDPTHELVGKAKELAGGTGSSHAFDISNGEAFGLRSLGYAGYRAAAEATFTKLAERFKSDDVSKWREPRRLYNVSAQGAAATPKNFPFFDRGTWEQLIELSP